MSNYESVPVRSDEISGFFSRRSLLLHGGLVLAGASGILGLAGCGPAKEAPVNPTPEPSTPSQSETPTAGPTTETDPDSPERNPEKFIKQAGESLLAMKVVDKKSGGWKFKSAIQDGHFQTDRDVGAASVGMGFLSLAEHDPDDPRWLEAAVKSADWLTSVSHVDTHGGRYWNDYDDDGETSSSVYTSFDDGAIGIGDFYWRLSEKTKLTEHKDMALASVRWTLAQAENIGNDGTDIYRWRWDMGDEDSQHNMGMGMGQSGIIQTLAVFYERTKLSDPDIADECRHYIEGAERYVSQVRKKLGKQIDEDRPLPETGDIDGDGGTALNSGYLSGSAGAAFMYLTLHKTFGEQVYLDKANELFDWLNEDTDNEGSRVNLANHATTWQLMRDPEDDDDTQYATGFEEGNAGIGWTYLQAYNLTGEESYLTTAKRAANWLIEVAHKKTGGLSWYEDENSDSEIVHANLNNGAAGIGMFLKDMYVVTGDETYQAAADGALTWLMASAKIDANKHLYWNDNGGENDYAKDPSWHWGTSGITAAAIRIAGGSQDIPGMQSGFEPR